MLSGFVLLEDLSKEWKKDKRHLSFLTFERIREDREKGKEIMQTLWTSECWQAEKKQYKWHVLSVQKKLLKKEKGHEAKSNYSNEKSRGSKWEKNTIKWIQWQKKMHINIFLPFLMKLIKLYTLQLLQTVKNPFYKYRTKIFWDININ